MRASEPCVGPALALGVLVAQLGAFAKGSTGAFAQSRLLLPRINRDVFCLLSRISDLRLSDLKRGSETRDQRQEIRDKRSTRVVSYLQSRVSDL